MGTSLHAIKKRIDALAAKLWCCPQHATPLICLCQEPPHHWVGTDADMTEWSGLHDRFAREYPLVRPTAIVCRCGERMWCADCYDEQMQTHVLTPDPLTEAERVRFSDILQLMVPGEAPTPPPGPVVSVEWPTADIAEPSPPPVVPVERIPPPPAQVPIVSADDDDEDVPDELVALVEQLRHRLQP